MVGAREEVSTSNAAGTHQAVDGRGHGCSEEGVPASFTGGMSWGGELERRSCRGSRKHTSR